MSSTTSTLLPGNSTVVGDLEVKGKITADYVYSRHGFQISEHPVWDDMRTPLSEVTVQGDNPPTNVLVTNLGGGANTAKLQVVEFGSSNPQPKEIFIHIQTPHAWKEGTDLKPHVHIMKSGTATGNVKFGLEYSWANVGDPFPTPTTVYLCNSTSLTAADQYKHLICSRTTPLGTDSCVISGAGKRDSSMLMMRLFRNYNDVDDTLQEPVWALEFDIHYQVDTFGSWYEYPPPGV
eukprot:jgi/Mesvir1/9811/Mv15208-RA.1